ncbi:hypothetical protein BESB_006050 [Besnoitia besnoiti]|uniref:Uncharacterized protein n=1 Tax=Besnoitia besnoiti TaxID=94643 RepID=A0A2A9MLV1_BESBE|nr:hypothetical protein BESB_006050 [Besnoitia besnoiti]PFH38264.1 hypothetical protein BESB_006050 [Besnoitia besnoiti]
MAAEQSDGCQLQEPLGATAIRAHAIASLSSSPIASHLFEVGKYSAGPPPGLRTPLLPSTSESVSSEIVPEYRTLATTPASGRQASYKENQEMQEFEEAVQQLGTPKSTGVQPTDEQVRSVPNAAMRDRRERGSCAGHRDFGGIPSNTEQSAITGAGQILEENRRQGKKPAEEEKQNNCIDHENASLVGALCNHPSTYWSFTPATGVRAMAPRQTLCHDGALEAHNTSSDIESISSPNVAKPLSTDLREAMKGTKALIPHPPRVQPVPLSSSSGDTGVVPASAYRKAERLFQRVAGSAETSGSGAEADSGITDQVDEAVLPVPSSNSSAPAAAQAQLLYAAASALTGTFSLPASIHNNTTGNYLRIPSVTPAEVMSSAGATASDASDHARSCSAQDALLRLLSTPISSTPDSFQTQPCVAPEATDDRGSGVAPVGLDSPVPHDSVPTRESQEALPDLSSVSEALYSLLAETIDSQNFETQGEEREERNVETGEGMATRGELESAGLRDTIAFTGACEQGRTVTSAEGQVSLSAVEKLLLELPCNPASCPTCLGAVAAREPVVDSIVNKLADLHSHLSIMMDLLLRQHLSQRVMASWLRDLQRQHQKLREETGGLRQPREVVHSSTPPPDDTPMRHELGDLTNKMLPHHRQFVQGLPELRSPHHRRLPTVDGQERVDVLHSSSEARRDERTGARFSFISGQRQGAGACKSSTASLIRPANQFAGSSVVGSGTPCGIPREREIKNPDTDRYDGDGETGRAEGESQKLLDDPSNEPCRPQLHGVANTQQTGNPTAEPSNEGWGQGHTGFAAPGEFGFSTSVYSRGSNVRHAEDPFPHCLMIQLIQPLPTGIKLEMKAHRPSSTPADGAGDSTKQGAPREYALRVSLTRHDTKYISFHSLRGILPAYNEAVRLRNKFAALPFLLPTMTLKELEKRKSLLEEGALLPGHGPREAFMTVQQRMTYYRQVARSQPSNSRGLDQVSAAGPYIEIEDKQDSSGTRARRRLSGDAHSEVEPMQSSDTVPITGTDQEPDLETPGGSQSSPRRPIVGSVRKPVTRGTSALSENSSVPRNRHRVSSGDAASKILGGDAGLVGGKNLQAWKTMPSAAGAAPTLGNRTQTTSESIFGSRRNLTEIRPVASLRGLAEIAARASSTGTNTRARPAIVRGCSATQYQTYAGDENPTNTPASPTRLAKTNVGNAEAMHMRLIGRRCREGDAAPTMISRKRKADVSCEELYDKLTKDFNPYAPGLRGALPPGEHKSKATILLSEQTARENKECTTNEDSVSSELRIVSRTEKPSTEGPVEESSVRRPDSNRYVRSGSEGVGVSSLLSTACSSMEIIDESEGKITSESFRAMYRQGAEPGRETGSSL